jgi:hypothetical protein
MIGTCSSAPIVTIPAVCPVVASTAARASAASIRISSAWGLSVFTRSRQLQAVLRPSKEVSTNFSFKGLNLIARARLREVNLLSRG